MRTDTYKNDKSSLLQFSQQCQTDEAIELITRLYDLHDAHRWLERFMEKNKQNSTLEEHLREALNEIDFEITQKMNLVDRLVSDRARKAKTGFITLSPFSDSDSF